MGPASETASDPAICAPLSFPRWGPAIFRYFQQPDEYFASSGHRPVA
jgi:hypothetical protein